MILQSEKYGQVYVCDDGSSDMTAPIANRLARVIRHKTNEGKGSALRHLFQMAIYLEADSVITIDADGQHNPDEIPFLLEGLKDADMIIGARRTIPAFRLLGNKLLSGVMGFDALSGFRAYRGYILSDVLPKERRMGADIEILQRAIDSGYTVQQVPISAGYAPIPHKLNPVLAFTDIAVSQIRRKFR